MRKVSRYIGALLLSGMMVMPMGMAAGNAEQRNSTSGNHRTTTSTTRNNSSSAKPANNNSGSRPGGNGSNSTRPNGNPDNSGTRPGGNNGNNGNVGNSGNRPGSSNRPNNGTNPGNRPGNPGNGHPGNKPGHGHPGGPGYGPGYGSSAPRPGAGSRPGSQWGVPYRDRWERPIPPPPARYGYTRIGVPSISTVLGLTFGSFINFGIESLLNSGYSVVSAYDNAIYLNNVSQYGIMWPEATIYYGPTGMNGARFQYSSYSPSTYNYDLVYNQLCRIYGAPISSGYGNGVTAVTWWGGNNTGYITLQFSQGRNQYGNLMYYTDLIYGL